ncbi:uncharacterized protein [Spinacia oleracea]|uniref:Reverse transcriptase zinc-binding domain-containing protein n=1 Tax=Spinacia oleracea TaxID=3562 RepID=A0A9R0J0A7_SPIOL|nr:uncharacterized protein LOC110797834 [Spinacia oleracea]
MGLKPPTERCNRLKTRDRLQKHGINAESYCLLCGTGTKSHSHIFFDCIYSRKCRERISQWIDMGVQIQTLKGVVRLARKITSRFKRRIFSVCVLAVIYQIWKARNNVLWHQHLWCIDNIVKKNQFDVKHRVNAIGLRKITGVDRDWFGGLEVQM